MDAADRAAGQLPGQHIIKPLDVHCFDLTDSLLSKAGTDMVLDVATVTIQGTGPHLPGDGGHQHMDAAQAGR